jgi:hypothetical protein
MRDKSPLLGVPVESIERTTNRSRPRRASGTSTDIEEPQDPPVLA